MSLQFKINLSKTKQEEEDGYKGEENPGVWEMDLLEGLYLDTEIMQNAFQRIIL